MGGGRWNPWAELRSRQHVTLVFTLLRHDRGQLVDHLDGTVTIHLDPRLSQRERRCVLAHELVHEERRVLFTSATPSLVVRSEERRVWRETARRLVPADELAQLIDRAHPVPLELWEIAEHFDVDRTVARLACALLKERKQAA